MRVEFAETRWGSDVRAVEESFRRRGIQGIRSVEGEVRGRMTLLGLAADVRATITERGLDQVKVNVRVSSDDADEYFERIRDVLTQKYGDSLNDDSYSASWAGSAPEDAEEAAVIAILDEDNREYVVLIYESPQRRAEGLEQIRLRLEAEQSGARDLL